MGDLGIIVRRKGLLYFQPTLAGRDYTRSLGFTHPLANLDAIFALSLTVVLVALIVWLVVGTGCNWFLLPLLYFICRLQLMRHKRRISEGL